MTTVQLPQVEVPETLPPEIRHLSYSSISTYLRCPERWKRRYILGEYEPGSPAMLVGGAVGAAETANFQQKITSEADLASELVLDAYSDEFDLRAERSEIEWGEEKPGPVKDSGASVLKVYHEKVAPLVQPTAVEREFHLQLEGAAWSYIGYIDVETADNLVVDLKVKGKSLSQADADSDLQPTSYLEARRAEGHLADGFEYHVLKRTTRPAVERVSTHRSPAQLAWFRTRVAQIAYEIAWRYERDIWGGAVPGSWWCSQRFCGFWGSCPMGGAR